MTDHAAALLAAYRLGVQHGGQVEQSLFGSGSGGTSGSAPERQSPAGDQNRGLPLDDCVQTMGSAPGGRGRSAHEPVAWRTYASDGSEAVYLLYEQAMTDADDLNWSVEPLYRQPTLTDEEKTAIALAKSRLGTSDGDWQADDVLAALLERLG